MNYYTFVVSYDGTDYKGWQEQPHQKAVANVLKNVFMGVFQQDVSLVGASRTDGGVHANGQVVRVRTQLDLDPLIIQNAWNNRLPSDIVIHCLKKTDTSFHPQLHVEQKTYYYDIFTKRPTPFEQRFGWFYNRHIDKEKLKKVLQLFVGTHDFRSFCTGYEKEDTVRTVDEITMFLFDDEHKIRIIVKGQRFLYHMIRRIVGAAVTVASYKNISIDYIKKVFLEKNPEQTLVNAPAKGLVLDSIRYKQ